MRTAIFTVAGLTVAAGLGCTGPLLPDPDANPPPTAAPPAAPAPDGQPPTAEPAMPPTSAGPRWPATPKAAFTALSDAEAIRLVKPHLGAEERIAHAVFRGPFGPADDCLFAIVQRGPRLQTGGLLLCGDQTWVAPAFKDWAGDEVPAVMFEDITGDGYVEAIVLATWITGVGPTGVVPFQSNAVIRWDGTQLVQLPEVEAKIASLTTAREVRAALR